MPTILPRLGLNVKNYHNMNPPQSAGAPIKDLTKDSVAANIVAMAVPIMAGMLLQTFYYAVDMYFVSRLGNYAIAGVSGTGNLMLLIFALTQTLGVGIGALISQAVGRKDRGEANLGLINRWRWPVPARRSPWWRDTSELRTICVR